MATLKRGDHAPRISLAESRGEHYLSEDALTRGPLLVAFFKVSCPTCQYALPFIDRLYRQFQTRGCQVWGISQDNARDSKSFIEEYGLTFPVLINDFPYEVADAYGIHHVPTLFLIESNGQIELVSDGFSKADLLDIHNRFGNQFSVIPSPLFLPKENVPEFRPG